MAASEFGKFSQNNFTSVPFAVAVYPHDLHFVSLKVIIAIDTNGEL